MPRGHIEGSYSRCIEGIKDMHKQWGRVQESGVANRLGLGPIKDHGWTCHLECHEKVIECDWQDTSCPPFTPLAFNDLL